MACLDDIWFVLAFILFSLLIGVIGFRLFCGCHWYESFCCASMALGGNYFMSKDEKGVIFISFYSLYWNLIFFAIAALIIERIYHQYRGDNS